MKSDRFFYMGGRLFEAAVIYRDFDGDGTPRCIVAECKEPKPTEKGPWWTIDLVDRQTAVEFVSLH